MYNGIFEIGEHKYNGSSFCCRSFILDKNKPIVVSFQYAQNIPSVSDFDNNKDNIFGFNFLKHNSINVISFSPLERNNWYRDERIIDFLKNIVVFVNEFPVRCGYGSSMGGVAIGTFSTLLNLDKILLLNPISTLDKARAPFESRFNSSQSAWKGDYSDASQSTADGFIIYDPLCKEDKLHAKRFKGNLTLLPLVGAGHNVPKLLLDMKVIKELVLTFISTGKIKVDMKKRRECVFYYNNLLNNKKLTNSRARVLNAHKALLEHKVNSKYVYSYTNKQLYELEQSSIKLASVGEYRLAVNIMKHLVKIKPISKRYKSLFRSWSNQLL
ncbi:hypothetical protein [Psychromonas arctica]|uniref:hypothetical protein n=1 Tax=Psychromonas arctica TaxID=168275 RepID=UPI002FD3BA83